MNGAMWAGSARLLGLTAFLGLMTAALAPTEAWCAEAKLDNPFFAFDNGTGRGRRAPEAQANLLSELGYAGIGYTGVNGIPEMLRALDAKHLKMFGTYVGLQLGVQGPAYDPQLKQAIAQLKGRATLLWLYLRAEQSAEKHVDERENLQRSMGAWQRFVAAASPTGRQTLVLPACDIPLQIAVDQPADSEPAANTPARLVELNQAESVATVQWSAAVGDDGTAATSRRRLLASVPTRTGAEESRRFRLEREVGSAVAESAFRFEEINSTSLRLSESDKPVLVYHHGTITDERVPQNDPRRNRACYVHPVWGLNGEVLTDDFPKDHYHHHGIFWSWPHVLIDNQEYDLWLGGKIQQRFVRWLVRETGPVAAVLAVENGWFVGDRKVMLERVWLRAFRSNAGSRAIDFEFRWIPVERPVTLWGAEGKSYGGLTMRFAPREETVITVPAGRTTADLAETPLAWADMTARFEKRAVASGAAVFVHPGHPNYPPTWLTRHYGCLCVGWPGVQSKTFEPGQIIRTSYRVWIHGKPADVEQLRREYSGYTAANSVRWE